LADDQRLKRDWLTRHPVEVAWDLIGCVLRVSRDGVTVSGRIVETEAYAGLDDSASHSSRLKVAKTTMAGPPGTIYTYLSYGIHTMMNIVAHQEDQNGAVLIRALEPVDGLDVMIERRNGVAPTQVTKGPGSLCQAMGILLSDLGTDLLDSDTFTLVPGEPHHHLHASPRIGISRAVHAPWRFYDTRSRCISARKSGHAVERQEIDRLIPPPGTPIH
jgi:DNA-3-methyladenine glycosylase